MMRLEDKLAEGVTLSEAEQYAWVSNTGYSISMMDAIDATADTVDALVFLPYLFASTVYGARIRPDKSVVVPCLHDEPYARFSVIQETLNSVAGLVFNSTGEATLARRILSPRNHTAVAGAGFDPSAVPSPGAVSRGLGVARYIAYAGRREKGKNWDLLLEWATLYNQAYSPGSPLPLVTMGQGEAAPPGNRLAAATIRDLGFVPDAVRQEVFASAVAVAQLSLNESFSYVLPQAWLAAAPVIVHARCEVTRRFCEESGGGIPVECAEEYAEAVMRLDRDAALRQQMGMSGRNHVLARYGWTSVLSRLLEGIAAQVAQS